MRENMTNASEELKRVDHLIYVSLKYTRAVDVIRNVLERMINALEFMMNAHLVRAEEKGDIDGIPNLPIERSQLLRSTYPNNPQMNKLLDFYMLLRRIMRSKFTASREFRRHVTMTAIMESDQLSLDVTIDRVHQYYDTLKEHFDYTYETLKEYEANQ